MRKFMIEANETLITVQTIRGGKPFFGESPFFGKTMTTSHVLEEMTDDVTRIYRLNIETMGAPEDITEEVARQYIYRADAENFDFADSHVFPAFVLNSRAWALWNDDLEAEKPSHPGVYGTLDHRTQGLQKVGA
ncbi:hypothetical protein PH552_12140 [Rhizobium sp. CNPSo 3968]|uniref:hypothetical protein n=1 Tax=Rhizobium sp. CNPSo 3968 TaxID=3021408 RepID=UPI0025503D9E|nr:hypothetical protein [Rhizobium sp. CNPSo 3968]MDK4720094.1 hypothetical protein [Rhizobium sp. CNPSo 3968]